MHRRASLQHSACIRKGTEVAGDTGSSNVGISAGGFEGAERLSDIVSTRREPFQMVAASATAIRTAFGAWGVTRSGHPGLTTERNRLGWGDPYPRPHPSPASRETTPLLTLRTGHGAPTALLRAGIAIPLSHRAASRDRARIAPRQTRLRRIHDGGCTDTRGCLRRPVTR